jgi:hypothetical protein
MILLVIHRIKKGAKNILLKPYPAQGDRFNIKLEHLLKPEQKVVYYNSILEALISEIETKMQN